MHEYTGDDLIHLFKKLNIETGNINPYVIKGWFDTDSENLLNWFCSSITEENYVSVQEISEYINFENTLTEKKIIEEINSLNLEFPNLFEYDENLFEIELAENKIEILEEQLKDCDNQLRINEKLGQNLSAELMKCSSEEMMSNLDKEAAQQSCLQLSNELDKLNYQSFEQIMKYQSYLRNYEFAHLPEFINNADIIAFEEKFTDIVTIINSVIKGDSDLLDNTVINSIAGVLSAIEHRLFHSKVSHLKLQMEADTLNYVMRFLESYKTNIFPSFMDCEAVHLNIEFNKNQQNCILKVIEESLMKQTEQYINQPKVSYFKKELSFCQSRLSYLNKIRKGLINIFSHFVIMYDLYHEEKLDISSSNQFFKNIIFCINNSLQDSIFRKEAMLKITDEYDKCCQDSTENNFKIIGHFGLLLTRQNKFILSEILEKTSLLRSEIQDMEQKHFSDIINFKIGKDLVNNIQKLKDFLISGPTCNIVSVPHVLQPLLSDVDLNLRSQNASVKSMIQIIQKTKDKFSKDKWLRYRRQLWMNFIFDSAKMFTLLDHLKDEAKKFPQQNI